MVWNFDVFKIQKVFCFQTVFLDYGFKYYAFILLPSWETPITWDFLDPSFIEIVILLVFLFFFYAFYHICILLSSVGEGNGTPLQYSCLENPMDGGAW